MSSSAGSKSLELVKVLYVEPLDNLQWHGTVLEHITKPMNEHGFMLDFTVCRDHLFALHQLRNFECRIIMLHASTQPLQPVQFKETLRSLGLTMPLILVLDSDSEELSDNIVAEFNCRMAKPISSNEICEALLNVLRPDIAASTTCSITINSESIETECEPENL
jgi:hypothetical protein